MDKIDYDIITIYKWFMGEQRRERTLEEGYGQRRKKDIWVFFLTFGFLNFK